MIKLSDIIKEANQYGIYHKSYTDAIETAKEYAAKKGYEISEDEAFNKIAVNSKRPSVGKTTRVSVQLTMGGKPTKKQLHIQVYGMEKGFELNCYIG